jgi:hypothetical protein
VLVIEITCQAFYFIRGPGSSDASADAVRLTKQKPPGFAGRLFGPGIG